MKIIFLLTLIISLVSCESINVKGYKGEPLFNFNGSQFHNYNNTPTKSVWDIIKWQVTKDRKVWPEELESKFVNVELPNREESSKLRWTFINHATFLIQAFGLNILTDPIWSDRCSPFSFLGPKRHRKPAIAMEKLPLIDVVYISHNHYDHMDVASIQKLEKLFQPLFIVGLGNKSFLSKLGVKRIIELNWWESHKVNEVNFEFVAAQHFSRRGLFDTNKTLWGGIVISHNDKSIYHAGDSGYAEHYKMINEKYKKIDLAFLPIGAYEPRNFMKTNHMNPEEAVKAHLDLKAIKSVGMHFGTFQLTDEQYDDPIIELEKAKKKYNINEQSFISPEFGQSEVLRL